jgi:glycoside/pentoside/hexuronide:cation symporter, GPH family
MQNYFLQSFLLEIAKVSPLYVGIIMIVRKIWDAVTDPFIGTLSDSLVTPWGRRRPWILISALPLGIYWLLQWMVQPFGEITLFFYFLIILICYSTLHTFQVVPYRALIPDVALTYNTRSSVATWMQGLGQVRCEGGACEGCEGVGEDGGR